MKTRLPHGCGLLVARNAADGDGRPKHVGIRPAEIIGAIFHLGQHFHRNVKQVTDRTAPPTLADVVQHRTSGIGRIGRVHRPVGQLPDQKTIDGAKQQPALGCAVARAFDIVQYPRQLGPRKIRVEQQAGAVGDHFFVARVAQGAALAGSATVLPDNRIVDRGACVLVPDNDSLALVGDADGGNFCGGDARLVDGPAAGRLRGAPQVARIVFNPAGLRKMLREFFLDAGD